MMKCTALFNSVSNISANAQAQTRTGGWSESVYNTQSLVAAREEFLAYCALRAAILPKGFAIVGQRFQEVDGSSSTYGRRFPGNPAYASDIPQAALQLKANASGAVNVRRWTYRGVPDLMITEGEYLPTTTYKNAVDAAARFISGGAWRFKGRDLDNTLFDLVSITTGGVMTTAVDSGFDSGWKVQLFRCKDAAGKGVTGKYLVGSTTSNTVVTLANYKANAVVSGQVRRVTDSDFALDPLSAVVERVVVRKVGRPFGGYVGRHSRRK